jgi:hypothetical protein
MSSVNVNPPVQGMITGWPDYDNKYFSCDTSGECTTFSGFGVPPNSLGNNGDWYLRIDGVSATTRQYHKEAGAWVGAV